MANAPSSRNVVEPNLRKVITPPFRMSFPSLLEPKAGDPNNAMSKKTFSLTMMFPPKTDLTRFQSALKAAMTEKFGNQGNWPGIKHGPKAVIRDFEEYNSNSKKPLAPPHGAADWKGWTMIRANCPEKTPPLVVGSVRDDTGTFPRITDAREIYGGRWANAVIEAYYFDAQKNNGATFGLRSVQLLKHDTAFGITRSSPEEDYKDATEEWSGQADAFERGERPTMAARENDNAW